MPPIELYVPKPGTEEIVQVKIPERVGNYQRKGLTVEIPRLRRKGRNSNGQTKGAQIKIKELSSNAAWFKFNGLPETRVRFARGGVEVTARLVK